MAEETAGTDHVEPTDQAAEPQGAEGGKPTDWKAEARKWEERAKANKAKADQWDAKEEANKTELQKANELAEKYKRQLDGIAAEKKRAEAVKTAAEKYRGQQADLNYRLDPEIESIFVMSSPEYGYLSSSVVRQIASLGGDVEEFVPANVVAALKRRFD